MLFQERVNVGLIDPDATLLTGGNEVEVQAQAEPAVEWNPVEDEVELVLNEEKDAQRRPVHEPWRENAGVGSAQGFVGEEDGEGDGEQGGQDVGYEAEHGEKRRSV